MAKIRNFQTQAYVDIVQRFKEKFEISKDTEIADNLGVSPASFFNYKKNDTLPFEKIVLACIKKNISLDSIFYDNQYIVEQDDIDGLSSSVINSQNKSEVEDLNHAIYLLNDKFSYVVIPQFVEQNKEKSIFAFVQNEIIFFIDTNKNVYETQSYYLLKKSNMYYIRYIEITVDDTYLIYSVDDNGVMTDTKFELSKEEFSNFIILGVVVKKLTLRES